MKKVRWGLLSTAHINRRVIPAMRASRRGELVAVASRDLAAAQAYASQWEITHSFGSYQAMLDSGMVDAVYIGLPNHLHAEWSIRAMQSGVHVLCEKPFALSMDEVERMIAASQQTGRVLAEAFMYIHHPQTKVAREWALSGKLGEIRLVQGAFHYVLTGENNVRLAPEYGGGSLWDVGVYPLSFAQLIYDSPPESVAGMQHTGQSGIDLAFVGQMTYPGGGMAMISASFISPDHTWIEICGSLGRLHLNFPFTGTDRERRMIYYPVDGRPIRITVPRQELYSGEIEDMHAAILDGAAPYLSLAETRDHVRTVLALYESARTGKVVKIEGLKTSKPIDVL